MIGQRGWATGARAVVVTAVVLGGTWTVSGDAEAQARHRGDGVSPARVEAYLDSIRSEPGRLREFTTELPKGGDLHTHLSGAASTDELIALAIRDDLCIDTVTFTAMDKPCSRSGRVRPIRLVVRNSRERDRVVRAWSMKGFSGQGGQSGHDHFFATFGKFGAATSRRGDMLAEVASRAAAQHIYYLEPLISRQGDALNALTDKITWTGDLPEMARQITSSPQWNGIIKAAIADTDADLARMRWVLRCGSYRPDPGCRVTIRIDHQVGRATEPKRVYANLLLGFSLAQRDPRVVGVNLVQPEDNPIALRDYALQMRMVGFLHQNYPGAHVTLHAGELTSQFADPEALSFHVRDAVNVAGADRIGHGVDIAGEDDSEQTLATMAARHVLVEINLTSNCQVLQVCKPHPFTLYRQSHVPVTLSTDDEGVEHTDLSYEYQRAITYFHLTYTDLKTLARASLDHAFLQGESLWADIDDYRPTRACSGDIIGGTKPSAACSALLRRSPKAAAQWRQEADFLKFEQRYGDDTTARRQNRRQTQPQHA